MMVVVYCIIFSVYYLHYSVYNLEVGAILNALMTLLGLVLEVGTNLDYLRL